MRKMTIAALAFGAALFANANAALLTYEMTFRDAAGAVVGTGVLSYDPDVREEIWLYDGANPCDPAEFGPDSPCQLAGTLTPGHVEVAIDGDFVSGLTYLDGDLDCSKECVFWETGAISGWRQYIYAFFYLSASFDPVGLRGTFSLNDTPGTVEYALVETPLPAAALLFPAGLLLLSQRSRRSEGRPRRTKPC